jgi:predicted secreted hydrolase
VLLAGPAGTEEVAVTGEAWLDHEFSSSQLGAGQVGWDWLSVQLRDGREVMLYRLRRADGSADPASRLTWVDAAGRTSVQPFTWEIRRAWRSPATADPEPRRFSRRRRGRATSR